MLGCYLRADNTVLPQWGFKQIEVSCQRDVSPNDMHTYWNVESHWNHRCEYTYFNSLLSSTLHVALSARWRYEVLQIAVPARFLASQRSHDDIQQRPHPRPRQGGYPRFQTN